MVSGFLILTATSHMIAALGTLESREFHWHIACEILLVHYCVCVIDCSVHYSIVSTRNPPTTVPRARDDLCFQQPPCKLYNMASSKAGHHNNTYVYTIRTYTNAFLYTSKAACVVSISS